MVQRVSRAQRSPAPTFDELGTTGLRHYGGFVVEEWLTRLSGRRGVWVWREMADNDPVIGAILFAIEMLARGVEWTVEPGADPKAAELVEQCKDDLSGTWEDFISEAFSMLTYGWAFHEIVYKRRQGQDPGAGPDGQPLPSSRYDDGLIGWRKLPVRAQETLEQWQFSNDGGIDALVQVAYDGVRRTIPMEKALLFRTSTKRNNPEGRAILRNGFIPWFRKKNIEEIEVIGIERDLAGLPTLSPPPDLDLSAPGNEDLRQAAQDLVTAVRRDEDEGILFLTDGWTFELVTTGGSRQLDTDAIIRRYDQRIATTVLADFILLAQDNVGSFALGKVKVDTFGQAMQAWLGSVAGVLNRYAIPRLLKLNGMAVTDPPQFVPGDVGELDLGVIGEFLQGLSLAGAPIDWSGDLMSTLFKLAGLPEPEEAPTGDSARGTDHKAGDAPYGEAGAPASKEPDDAADPTQAAPDAKGDGLRKFDPNELRDKDGKWSATGAVAHEVGKLLGGSGRTGMHPASSDDRSRLKIPPAWTDVHIAEDASAALQAIGKDAKGRDQYRYSAAHSERQAAAKFARISSLEEKLPEVDRALSADGSDTAKAMLLVRRMGLRPGSRADTGADKQAYGATTLRADHVHIAPDGSVHLDFTGKKGVHIRLQADPETGRMLSAQAAGKEPDDALFDTSDSKLRAWLANVAPGFKVKDFRTSLATSQAQAMVASMPMPRDAKEAAKMRNEVGDRVAALLGNTRAMALGAYINPAVFAGWPA